MAKDKRSGTTATVSARKTTSPKTRGAPLRRRPTGSGLAGVLSVCLLCSGAASLALEAVWMRELRLAFGSTTLATSTILVAYMLGLGTGGWMGGWLAQWARRPLAAYGWLEATVGVYALAVPWLVHTIVSQLQPHLADAGFWVGSGARFFATLVVLLLPTVAMGATLPVVVRTLAGTHGRVGQATALLYAANTVGAVVGVFAATFWLLPSWGLRGSNILAAMLDILVGVLVIAWAHRVGVEHPPADTAPEEVAQRATIPGGVRHTWVPLVAYSAVGFSALAYEVCWTRALASVFGSSTYAFGTMLGTFLVGIAAGSFAVRRHVDRFAAPTYAAACATLALGVASLATLKILFLLPDWFPWCFLWLGATYSAAMGSSVLLALLALLPPTLILGALFPLLVRVVHTHGAAAARSVSRVYLFNTIGSAFGAFAAAFLLLPWLGLERTLWALISLNAATAILLLLWQREHRGMQWMAPLGSAAAVLTAFVWLGGARIDPAALTRGVFRFPISEIDVGVAPAPLSGPLEGELLYYRDGWNATVSVHRIVGELSLRVNGKADASTRGDLPTQVLLGHLGYLFRPDAAEVAIVGLASGITAGSAALHPSSRIDLIEIEPAMVEASRFFDELNHQPLDQPHVRLVLEDARAYLAAKRAAYDLIVSEPSNPWMAGPANLFTREFFQLAARALRPGGLLVQWVQLYAMPPEAVASIFQALRESFPYVYGFAPGHGDTDLLLVASREAWNFADWPGWDRLPPPARADLVRAGVFDSDDVRALLYLTPEGVAELAAKTPVANSDDNLFVEFLGPQALYADPTGPPNWEQIDAQADKVAHFWQAALPPEAREGPAAGNALGELALAYLRREARAVARALVQRAEQLEGGPLIRAAKAQVDLEADETNPERLSQLAAVLREAVSASPQSYSARYLLAKVEYDRQEHLRALAHIESGLQLRPGDLRLRRLRLQALLGVGRGAEAWEEAQALLASRLRDRDLDLYWDAAQAAAQTGRDQNVVELVRKYLAYYPDSPEQWGALADALSRLGDATGAAQARRNAEQAKRNFLLALHMQARRIALLGAREEAIARLQNIVFLDPDYVLARQDLQRLQSGRNLEL